MMKGKMYTLWLFYTPGFMKSDKPKSVAFRGESSLVDLKRKFYRKRNKGTTVKLHEPR